MNQISFQGVWKSYHISICFQSCKWKIYWFSNILNDYRWYWKSIVLNWKLSCIHHKAVDLIIFNNTECKWWKKSDYCPNVCFHKEVHLKKCNCINKLFFEFSYSLKVCVKSMKIRCYHTPNHYLRSTFCICCNFWIVLFPEIA